MEATSLPYIALLFPDNGSTFENFYGFKSPSLFILLYFLQNNDTD